MSLADQSWCPTSVQVTVLQARGLRTKGKSGTNDAYAVMQVGKEKYQTSVVEKSVAPVWKEEAAFDLPPLHLGGGGGGERGTLHVHVLHRALVGPDKPLGQAVINLLPLSEDKTRSKTEWFKLLDKTGKADKDRGEVLLDIQFMRNNMTASMFDLSAAGKSRSRLGKFKDKVRGKKKESDTMSSVVPSFSQVLTDSEDEAGEVAAGKDEKKKKHKIKSLFSPKSNLQRNMSQSMSVLPAKNSSLSGSQSSGLNVESSEGKKKFKFMIHKRSGSSDSKDSSSGLQKHSAVEQSNLCINGSHVYCEEPQPRTSRIGSNFSLASSGHGSMEDVPESSPPPVDSLKAVRQYSPWTEEEEEETAEVENITADMDELRREEEERISLEEERRRKEEEEERLRREKEALESLAEEKRRQEEEERKRIEKEEERIQREEERKSREEQERVRREEEERERLAEEERRLEEEERRRIEEEEKRQREEEERIRLEEERAQEERRRQEEEERVRRQEEERERLAEEKRRLEDQERRQQEEEERIREEEERRQEEEARERARKEKEEYERLLEERRRLEDEERRQKEEEERIRKEEQERIRIEEERRRSQEEEDRCRKEKEEYELAKEKSRLEEEERERIKVAEKNRREEEERIRMEEEKCRKEQEAERVRREEEEREEKRRLEEEEKTRIEAEERQREEEERIRKEDERRLEEENQARKEKEEYERLVEEKKRQEEEERIRKEEQERIRIEDERRRQEEEDRGRREKEKYERLIEEKRRLEEEERKQKEEERERIEGERRRREEEEERAKKEKEEMERLVEEERRLVEQETRRIEEEEIRRVESENLGRDAEQWKKTENKIKDEDKAADITSTNHFDQNFSNNPFDEIPGTTAASDSSKVSNIQQGCHSAVPSVRNKAISTEKKKLISAQRERRPAPQPPGRNQAESQSEQDVSTQHLTQINIKTANVLPQQWTQMVPPLSQSPTDTEDTQSVMQSSTTKGSASVAKPSKRLAPSRPRSGEKELSPDHKTDISQRGGTEKKQVHVVYGLNPFEDDEDELKVQDDTKTPGNTSSSHWPPPVSGAADKDAASQAKLKSSKVARAPPPPAKKAATSSTSIHQNTDGGHVMDDTGAAVSNNGGNQLCDPRPEAIISVPAQGTSLKEPQPARAQEVPPTTSRRLQPVKPLNPLDRQSVSVVREEKYNQSTGILSEVQDKAQKTKVNDTGLKGPYSQLTREELIALVLKQEKQLSARDKKISELEQYIDNLLVRVMEEKPSILMSMSSLKKAV